jgi:anti-sigma regulatory factor (Ser/Thr protein kinase)
MWGSGDSSMRTVVPRSPDRIDTRSVSCWVDGRIVVEVTDVGGGFDRARVWETHPPEPYGPRGRGLWITRQLTDLVSILSGERGTTVRIELSPDPHIGA